MSQHEFARVAGVSQGAIGNVIRGDRQPGARLCLSIANALKVPPEIVFRRAGLLPARGPRTEAAEQMLYLIEQLPPGEQAEILELLRFKVERRQKSKSRPGRLLALSEP